MTWNGKPVDGGMITFVPTEKPERGLGVPIAAEGKFDVTIPGDIANGDFRVRIQAARKTGRQLKGLNVANPGLVVDEFEQSPVHYYDDSKLTITVEAGKNQHFEFDVKGEPEKR